MVRIFLRTLSSSPLAPQLRRFVLVGTFTAGVQMVLLWLFVHVGRLNYLVGAVIAIEITIVLSYVLNNVWTFQGSPNTGRDESLSGQLTTTVVRGTAKPIQVAELFTLVEWASSPYLVGNGGSIVVSRIYRYTLDGRWTWGDK